MLAFRTPASAGTCPPRFPSFLLKPTTFYLVWARLPLQHVHFPL
jgi:hypothetical protein